jgi:SNF2 family DNA or RNA helicase
LYPAGVTVKRKLLNEKTGEIIEHVKTLEVEESAKLADDEEANSALELISELADANEKVLVFSNYKEPLFKLEKLIAAKDLKWTNAAGDERDFIVRRITGDQNDVTKANVIDLFNDPESDVRMVVATIKAGGTGLNLQGACSHSIFLDLDWTPGINEQAEDRLHREGQKDTVFIHIIQAEDCIDGYIAKKIEQKVNMIEGTIERDELRQALKDGLI